jgi:hypothetical protein
MQWGNYGCANGMRKQYRLFKKIFFSLSTEKNTPFYQLSKVVFKT